MLQKFFERINKMKKNIALFMIACLLIMSAMCVSAANDEISVYLQGFSGIDGEKIQFDISPQTINGRTMVPIRAIFEAMGASVNWDDATKTAICTKDGTVVKMTLNSTTEYINDNPYSMDVAPVIISGRTLAPARYVAEAFGYNVKWDEMTRYVLISKKTDYNISDVIDGTRAHPYKMGDAVSFNFHTSDDETGKCTLTLSELINPEEMKKLSDSEYLHFPDDMWFIKGHIRLDAYSSGEACDKSDFIYSAEVVTSKIKPMGNYTWYSSPSISDYNVTLYEGGETDCYIPIHTEKLTDGETADYFTFTYRYGEDYNDKKTVWFTLK